jgi:hypothetical protein
MVALAAALSLTSHNGYASIEEACGTTTWDLTAGQTINVGTVTVSNDTQFVYVNYTLDTVAHPGATLGNLHLWIGNDLANIPANSQGTPVPGQFCQADGGACYDATGLTSYTFAISFADLNIVDVTNACPLSLYVVTHAEVDLDGPSVPGHETAFGGPNPGSGNRWWFYGIYEVCCEQPPNPPVPTCETAFGKSPRKDGGYVWTTSKKSNPERYPSLKLTRNRWGWALNMLAPGTYVQDLYAGAGLNDTSKGTLVGTVYVSWSGSQAKVTYKTLPGYTIEEVHLYAKDARPTTTAPGQYGYLDEFDPNVSFYTFLVPLVDFNKDGVWVITHAVVCAE